MLSCQERLTIQQKGPEKIFNFFLFIYFFFFYHSCFVVICAPLLEFKGLRVRFCYVTSCCVFAWAHILSVAHHSGIHTPTSGACSCCVAGISAGETKSDAGNRSSSITDSLRLWTSDQVIACSNPVSGNNHLPVGFSMWSFSGVSQLVS